MPDLYGISTRSIDQPAMIVRREISSAPPSTKNGVIRKRLVVVRQFAMSLVQRLHYGGRFVERAQGGVLGLGSIERSRIIKTDCLAHRLQAARSGRFLC